jgi:hypothetical protein
MALRCAHEYLQSQHSGVDCVLVEGLAFGVGAFVGLVVLLICRHHRCVAGHRLRPRLSCKSVGFRFLGPQWE